MLFAVKGSLPEAYRRIISDDLLKPEMLQCPLGRTPYNQLSLSVRSDTLTILAAVGLRVYSLPSLRSTETSLSLMGTQGDAC